MKICYRQIKGAGYLRRVNLRRYLPFSNAIKMGIDI